MALSRVKSRPVARPHFAHPRTLSECGRLSAAVRGDLHVRPLNRESRLTGVLGTSWIFTHTNRKLRNLWVIGTKRCVYNFGVHFQELLIENPELSNNLLMSAEARFHVHGTVNKNFRYWSAVIPKELHQRPLYDPKVTVFVCCLVQRIHWSLLLWGLSHHSHMARLHRDVQWISSPQASTTP